MVRVRRAAIVHSQPDIDASGVGMLDVGEEHEVMQQAENLGLHWVRVHAGWICVEGVEPDGSGSEVSDRRSRHGELQCTYAEGSRITFISIL